MRLNSVFTISLWQTRERAWGCAADTLEPHIHFSIQETTIVHPQPHLLNDGWITTSRRGHLHLFEALGYSIGRSIALFRLIYYIQSPNRSFEDRAIIEVRTLAPLFKKRSPNYQAIKCQIFLSGEYFDARLSTSKIDGYFTNVHNHRWSLEVSVDKNQCIPDPTVQICI